MPGAKIALSDPAEVGGLVPAVSGCGQTVDDALEVRLHRLGLAVKLGTVGMGEARSRLGLELVAGQVLRAQLDCRGEIRVEVGGALAGNPVDEVEGDVVKSGITKMVERAPDGVRLGNAVQSVEEARLEALDAEGDPVHSQPAKHGGELSAHRLGVRLHCDLAGVRQGGEQPLERAGLGERRRAAAEKDRLEPRGEGLALEPELEQKRVDVLPVLGAAPHHRDEVAVAAALRAERQVYIKVMRPGHDFRSPSRLRTARNAS